MDLILFLLTAFQEKVGFHIHYIICIKVIKLETDEIPILFLQKFVFFMFLFFNINTLNYFQLVIVAKILENQRSLF